MTVRCGRGHEHQSIAEVRCCYGRPERPADPFATIPGSERPNPGDLITERQLSFLNKLRVERGLKALPFDVNMSKREASRAIDDQLSTPKTDQTAKEEAPRFDPWAGKREAYKAIPTGYYATVSATGHNDLDFWFVRQSKNGKYTWVKRVIGGRADTAVRGRTAAQALDAILAVGVTESGNAFADALGHCKNCNRHLTDELSRQRRVGPDCWANGAR